jgi:hypothetical protein
MRVPGEKWGWGEGTKPTSGRYLLAVDQQRATVGDALADGLDGLCGGHKVLLGLMMICLLVVVYDTQSVSGKIGRASLAPSAQPLTGGA